MKKSKQILMTIIFVMCVSVIKAETLFEIKDSSNNTVFNISNDGLRVFNLGDTLMVISADAIRANISSSKGLSRSFSVTTTSSVKGKGFVNAFEVGTDETKINTGSTVMGVGVGGEKYSDLSPVNIFMGLNSGINTTPSGFYGNSNVFIGNSAGYTNTLGQKNIFIGNSAGYTNSEGDYNVFLGHNAGMLSTTGDRNVFIGYESGQANTIGTANTFVGEASGTRNIDGFGNSFFGRNAGAENNYGDYNTGIGYEAGGLNTTGNYNSCFGAEAGYYNQTGSSNSIFGYQAGKGVWGTSNSNNSLFGFESGYSINTGSNNVMIGSGSGHSNISGAGNVFLGYQSGYNETLSNKLYIANSNTATPLIKGTFPNTDLTFTTSRVSIIHPIGTSNGLYFQNTYNGNTDSWHLYMYTDDNLGLFYNTTEVGEWNNSTGVYSALSDKRFKKNISDAERFTEKIMKLQPKRYNFTTEKSDERNHIGLIAQDVIQIFPEFVYYNKETDTYTMDYAGLSVVAIQALKEQQIEINEMKKEIKELKELIRK